MGEPKPSITWYVECVDLPTIEKTDWMTHRFHGNKQIRDGSRYVMTMDVDQKLYYLARLQIKDLQISDKGEYSAVAKNMNGVGTATIYLNFQGGGKTK